MFKAIISRDNGEPWGSTGMTTTRWKTEIVPELVEIRELIATQPGLLLAALATGWDKTPIGGDPIPHVIAYDGNLYLEDGHHRVARAALRGMTHVPARVLVVN
jgi:hypothetical protein